MVEVMNSPPLYGVIRWIGYLPDQKEPVKQIAGLEMVSINIVILSVILYFVTYVLYPTVVIQIFFMMCNKKVCITQKLELFSL